MGENICKPYIRQGLYKETFICAIVASSGYAAWEPGTAERRYPTSKVRSSGPRGDTLCPRSGAAAMRRYPTVWNPR